MELGCGPENGKERPFIDSVNISSLENDELIIEENTIYEIDLNCYECLKKERQNKN